MITVGHAPRLEVEIPVETWFPTIIFFEDLELDAALKQGVMDAVGERADPILAINDSDTVTAINAPNDLHYDPRMNPLLDAFRPHLHHFLFETLHFDPEQIEFYVGRCWLVVGGDSEVSTVEFSLRVGNSILELDPYRIVNRVLS